MSLFRHVRGLPRSENGASSQHLWWIADATDQTVRVEVELEIFEPPRVPRIYFWALQTSFVSEGRVCGAGHLGLQWHPGFPDSRAVNWGGYRAGGEGGGELPGSRSRLPSAVENPNTRNFLWQPNVGYVLGIEKVAGSEPTRWRGSIFDGSSGITVAVRDLISPGEYLAHTVMWSEVFARCDDPPTTVRWSHPRSIDKDGGQRPIRSVRVTYQARPDGGCGNTNAFSDGYAVVQGTNYRRSVRHNSVVAVPTDHR